METLHKSEHQPLNDLASFIRDSDLSVEEVDARYMNSLIRGMAVTQMIGVVCEAGLPDALPDKDKHSIQLLAGELGVDGNILLRLSRALSTFGIFTVDSEGRIAHNALSRMLRRGHYSSQHWAARFWSSSGTWQAWGDLNHSLQSGEEAFKHVHQRQFFDYMHDHANEAETYRQYMSSGYPGRHEAISSMLEFTDAEIVIDVGGGTGALIRALLDRHPGIVGMVYDQPEVIRNLEPRYGMDVRSGNFFESVPSGGDVYILSWVLHDWPDAKALEILRSCRQAMTSASRLIIVERLINVEPANCDPFDLLLDINMLVLHEGQERTRVEFDALLHATGFTPLRLIRTQLSFSVFETVLV